MPTLILETAVRSRYSIGGVPIASPSTVWPVCTSCGSPMQFLAQLPTTLHDDDAIRGRGLTLLLFQCQAAPGMCDEWDPNQGGNAALLSGGEPVVELPSPDGETLLPARSELEFRSYESANTAETPDDAYCSALDDSSLRVLGKIGGRPLWIQGDETPTCSCGSEMVFFAQLECTGGGGINFGDEGAGYAFVCRDCPTSAKFLWQCT